MDGTITAQARATPFKNGIGRTVWLFDLDIPLVGMRYDMMPRGLPFCTKRLVR